MTNKELVCRFVQTVFNEHDLSRVDEFMREDYIQHNPEFPQGREGFVQGFEQMFKRCPDFRQELRHVIAEDDLVCVHAYAWGAAPGDVPVKVMDLYRIEDGRLAEHWDVLQKP